MSWEADFYANCSQRVTNELARCFGFHVWPWLAERRFFCRSGKPAKHQLALYRRWLDLTSRTTCKDHGTEREGVWRPFRCKVCGERLRDEWASTPDDVCSICTRRAREVEDQIMRDQERGARMVYGA